MTWLPVKTTDIFILFHSVLLQVSNTIDSHYYFEIMEIIDPLIDLVYCFKKHIPKLQYKMFKNILIIIFQYF